MSEIKRLKDEAAKLIQRAEQLTREQQAACQHPFKELLFTEGACSSRSHQEVYVHCKLCDMHRTIDVVLHNDLF